MRNTFTEKDTPLNLSELLVHLNSSCEFGVRSSGVCRLRVAESVCFFSRGKEIVDVLGRRFHGVWRLITGDNNRY
jgi:hypothetical protein